MTASNQYLQWAHQNGFCFKSNRLDDQPSIVPFSITPTKISNGIWLSMQNVQPLLSKLQMCIEEERSWLMEKCSELADSDKFIAKLLKIASPKQNCMIANLSRSDFLISQYDMRPKLVEINSIAVSFLYHSQLLADGLGSIDRTKYPDIIPNCTLRKVGTFFSLLVKSFASNYSHLAAKKIAILMVVSDNEKNTFDQFGLMNSLKDLQIIRMTFKQIAQKCRFEKDGHIWLSDEICFSTVYYRTGYLPHDYQSEEDWNTRRLLDASAAINVPSVAGQLVGMKKIKRELAKEESVEKFISCPNEVALIRSTFVKFWGFSSHQNEIGHTIEMLKSSNDLSHYVMKPQLEGGGNNIYDRDILSFLDQSDLDRFILMENIQSPLDRNVKVINDSGTVDNFTAVSEIGTFGCGIWSIQNGETHNLMNEYAGYLVRSKPSHTKEGGVMIGSAFLNTLKLTHDQVNK